MSKLKESLRSGKKIDTSNIDDQINFDELEKNIDKSYIYNHSLRNEDDFINSNKQENQNEKYKLDDLLNENSELKQVIEEMTKLIEKLNSELENHKQSLGKQSYSELTSKLLIKEKEYELLKRESALNLIEINKLNNKIYETNTMNNELNKKINDVIKNRDELEKINFKIKKENLQMKREADDIHTF